MSSLGIGIDVGGTKTALALVSSQGQVLEKETFPTEPEKGFPDFIARVKESYHRLSAPYQSKLAGQPVGLATPGPFDLQKGMMYDSPNLHWGDLKLGEEFEKALGTRVIWQNDATSAGFAEYLFGAGQGSKTMVYITISTGIGGGVVCDGKFLTGAMGNGAEFGHMPLVPGGERCNCGTLGCWEAYASGTAIGKIATKLRRRKTTARDVGDAWKRGEDWAAEIIRQTVLYSGQGVAIVAQNFDPDCIVFGGGVALGLGEQYIQAIKKEAEKISINLHFGETKFVLAALGSDSSLIGAAALTFS
ncbi:MAG: ROK family protein [Firmicutes bacterium]|nr:ROK family protein [Bacillota bacterium]